MRPAIEALWRLDVTFGAVLAAGAEPMVSRIKLAWWREALERLDREPAPGEPLLQAIQMHLLPAGISGGELAAMEEGWAALLADGPADRDAHAALRGGRLFALSARLLGAPEHDVAMAGMRWALVDLARHSSNADEARAAREAAARLPGDARWPRRLRPLGMLGVLASRDAKARADAWESRGTPARMLRMLRHRLTGN